MMRPVRHRQDRAAPGLLVGFFAATVVMVLAVVAIGRTGSDWSDIGAILLLIALAGLVLAAIRRQLREEEQPESDDAAGPPGNEKRT
jgi:uncharacterized protein involved in response to NO